MTTTGVAAAGKACAGVVEAHNVLGRLLTVVREELRRETSRTDA